MFKSRLFKRANACECGQGSCTCGSVKVMDREDVKAALETAGKLANYLEEVGGSFSDFRNVHEASKKMATFLRANTDVVPASVESAAKSVLSFQAKLASNDFDYDSLVDESGPNEMFDAPEDLMASTPDTDSDVTKELGNDEVPVVSEGEAKVAASELLGDVDGTAAPSEGGKGRWDNFSNEALTEMIKTLSETEGFATDSESQRSVSEMAEVLANRPTLPEPEEEKKEKSAKLLGLRIASSECSDCESPKCSCNNKTADSFVENSGSAPSPAGIPHQDLPENEDDPSGSKLPPQPGIRKESEPGIKTAASEGDWCVRWSEFDRKDQIVKKEKCFKTEAARTKFTDELKDKNNFKCFDSWSDPTPKVKEGKIASEAEEIKVAETAESKIEKLLKFVEDFDIESVLEAKGTAPSVQALQGALDVLKEKAKMVLQDVETQIHALEITEEKREESMEKKGSRIRGLRLAGIE